MEDDEVKIADARNALRHSRARELVAETLAVHSPLSVPELSESTGLHRDSVVCALEGSGDRFSIIDSLTTKEIARAVEFRDDVPEKRTHKKKKSKRRKTYDITDFGKAVVDSHNALENEFAGKSGRRK